MRRSLIVEQLAATLINEAMAGDPGPRTKGGGRFRLGDREFYPIDYEPPYDVWDPFFIPTPGHPAGFIINPDYLEQPPIQGGHDQVQGEPNRTEPGVISPSSRGNPINP
jgi:hypothetical protein